MPVECVVPLTVKRATTTTMRRVDDGRKLDHILDDACRIFRLAKGQACIAFMVQRCEAIGSRVVGSFIERRRTHGATGSYQWAVAVFISRVLRSNKRDENLYS